MSGGGDGIVEAVEFFENEADVEEDLGMIEGFGFFEGEEGFFILVELVEGVAEVGEGLEEIGVELGGFAVMFGGLGRVALVDEDIAQGVPGGGVVGVEGEGLSAGLFGIGEFALGEERIG